MCLCVKCICIRRSRVYSLGLVGLFPRSKETIVALPDEPNGGMEFYVIAGMGSILSDFFRSFKQRIINFYQRPGFFRKVISLVALTIAGLIAVVLGLFLLVWAGTFGSVPGNEELAGIEHPIASEVYSADSVLLGRYFLQERSPVSSDDLPGNLKQALIATEDIRFYDHSGIDVKSLLRVMVKTILLQRESSGGGSTLTQQLAKNLYPRKTHNMFSLPVNKIKEYIIAWRLEKIYTKDQILLLYLNTIPFSDNTFGIKTAADRFFSVSVNELTPDQSAVLVGMLKATHSYNPRLFPERSRKRRDVVLSQMEKYGYLKEEEKKTLQSKPVELQYNNTTQSSGVAPYFRSYIQQSLLAWCKSHKKSDGSNYNIYTDGLKIYTTIDSRLQRYAESAMQAQMKLLQQKFEKQLTPSTLESIAQKKIQQLPQYRSLKEEGLSDAAIIKELKKPLATKVFTWEGDKEVEMSTYDSLKHHQKFLQAGVLALDPHDGAIKVWVGGIDHRFFKYDHVRESTKRQVGSTLKPILYAAALEQGIGPCSYISAQKTSYSNEAGWTPGNTNDKTYERKYSMEGGLTGSVNTVSVKLLEKTGINNAIVIARKAGINSDLPAVPSLALGTPSISVIEMVSAYGTLANDGVHVKPYCLNIITDQNGEVVQAFEEPLQGTQAFSKATAQMMVHMLESVITEGTGSSLRSTYGIHNDVVGKTGTTQSNVDGWFIAVMPKLVVGAWVGADDPRMHFRSTALGQGAATALPIVGRFLQQANKDQSLKSVMWAKFEPLPAHLAATLACKESKSDRNLFQRIFKKKKSTKVKKFKKAKDRSMP